LTMNDNVHSDIETIWGSPLNDELTGTVGPQEINGYGGNDTLDGRSGADALIGSGGTDTASYANHTAGVTVTINGNANDGVPGENDNVQTSVENVTGGEDNDTLTGSSGVNTLAGGNGADTLNGLGNDDVLFGGGSNDKFVAGAGADDMFGGDGIDTGDYSARIVPETITLDDQPNDGSVGEGDNLRAERVFGGSNDDDITGDDQGNFLEGRGGDDTLTGLGNVDYLAGGDESDTVFGGDGDDVITNGASPDGADNVNGGAGTADLSTYGDRTNSLNVSLDNVADDGESGENDNVHENVERVFGGSAPDGLQGSSGDNLLAGGGGADTVAGAAGDDTLKGDAGTDSVFGGDDNDTLAGGPGADPLAGGPGYDTADYSSAGTDIDVSIDDVADDGVAAEGDNVMTTIEAVLGGRFNDKIEGDSDPNTLAGGLGADIIRGFDGADIVAGGNGVDTLRGGNGNDELHAVDATQDDLVCGPNIDAYAADNIDTVAADCENALP
jgi:Ca2+-binding RTX toxin-like protein